MPGARRKGSWPVEAAWGCCSHRGWCKKWNGPQCPSRPLTASGGTHPFHAFRYLRQDRIFRQTIISWIFLGFATLMMAPLRVEYLANPKYGVHVQGQVLTAFMVALLTGVIPNSA